MTHAMDHEDPTGEQDGTSGLADGPTPLTMVPGSTSPGRRAVLNRVRRAQGQLAGVLRMLEQERDPQAVLHQLKAVTGALDRAGFALVAQEWRERSGRADGEVEDELGDIEKLFLSLS